MKQFLQAAFRITLFQVVFIAILAGLKYILTLYKIIDKIERPFVWLFFGAGVIFVFAIGIMGYIENQGESFDEWKSKPKKSPIGNLMAGIASWGFAIPIVLFYVLFLYMIIPTSILMFIALYVGIVIRNCVTFFSKKQAQQTLE